MADIYREDIATIDLTEPLRREQVGKTFATGDKLGNRVGVRVRRNHVDVDLSGHAATGYFIRSDLQTVVIPGEVEDELAYVDIPQACLTERGPFSLAIKISGGDVTQTVRVLDGSLILTQTDTLIAEAEAIPTLDDIFAQIAAVEYATEQAEGAAEFANASGEQAYLLAQQATVSLTTQVNERLRRIAPPVIPEASGDGVIVLTDSSENSFERLSIFGRTTQDGTPSPENPVEMVNIGTKGNIYLMVRGKNLLDGLNQSKMRVNGNATDLVIDNGIISAKTSGAAYSGFYYPVSQNEDMLNASVGRRVTLRLEARADADISLSINALGSVRTVDISEQWTSITVTNASAIRTEISVYNTGNSLAATTLYVRNIMLSYDDNAVYEPYADGGSLTLIPPDEMRGVPVSSGGNYSDANGHQWICDEIDLARGVYIQRIAVQILDGTQQATLNPESNDQWTRFDYHGLQGVPGSGIMSDQYPQRSLDSQASVIDTVEMNGSTGYVIIRAAGQYTLEEWNARLDQSVIWIIYAIKEPVETPLTDDIMSAAMALKSLYPNTTIINDEGAGMLAAYVADTKLYIDNKFAALAEASIDQ